MTRRATNPPTRRPWGASPRRDGPKAPRGELGAGAFAASAKAERRRQKTRRKNHRQREESRRSAGEVLLSLNVRQEPCSSSDQGERVHLVKRGSRQMGRPQDGRMKTDGGGAAVSWTEVAKLELQLPDRQRSIHQLVVAATLDAGGFSLKLDREAAAARRMEESAASGSRKLVKRITLCFWFLSITTQYFVVGLE